MRILQVLHGFPPETGGGTERAVLALARAMQAAGHDVTVVAGSLQSAPPACTGPADHAGVPVFRLHRDDLYFESWFKAWSPTVSAAFAALLAAQRPDVVHVHHWIRLSTDLVRLARAAGATAAVTLHDYFGALATPVRRAGDEEAAPPPSPTYVSSAEADEAFAFHRRDLRADICAAHLRCAPSRSHAAGVQQLAPGPLGEIAVTPPPLPAPPARLPDGAVGGGRRLVAWGALYPEKGLETAIEALARSPGWTLELYGEAPEPSYGVHLEQRARGLPVHFRGAFAPADLQRVHADFALLPSLCHESYGLTLDEALLLGLPVLAADLPSYRERAPASSCAFFAPGDADALSALLHDEPRLRALARPAAPAVHSADDAARALLALYEHARAGALAPAPPVEAITQRERAALLFRRAERRLWTALQQARPPAPPEGFP